MTEFTTVDSKFNKFKKITTIDKIFTLRGEQLTVSGEIFFTYVKLTTNDEISPQVVKYSPQMIIYSI